MTTTPAAPKMAAVTFFDVMTLFKHTPKEILPRFVIFNEE